MNKKRVDAMVESLGKDVTVMVADGTTQNDKFDRVVQAIIHIEGIFGEILEDDTPVTRRLYESVLNDDDRKKMHEIIGVSMEALIFALGNPDVAMTMGKFYRRLYATLKAEGFSVEEAMRILTSARFPSIKG